MRIRKKKNLDKRIAAVSSLLIAEPENNRGGWKKLFASVRADGRDDCPCKAEIGCGKGSFAVGMAQRYPEVNVIAVEKVADVIMLAMEKAQAAGVDNLVFILGDAFDVSNSFADGELDGIYLNFSDPWPKKRHTKRRLTAPGFLKLYERILSDDAVIEMKTDNDGLFDYSLESFEVCGYEVSQVNRDIHANGEMENNVMTEYERNFHSKGKNINRLVAKPKGVKLEKLSDQ